MAYDENNIFAKIINKDIPSKTVFENDKVYAFEDINPQAPTHILIIPKANVATVNDFSDNQKELIGEMVITAKNIAAERGFAEDGYRLVINCNAKGGQEVYHVHLHLLAGRQLQWPPG